MAIVDYETTLSASIQIAGVGVHSGVRACMTMHPAEAGSGIRFRRTDLNAELGVIPARGDLVSDVKLGTTLQNSKGAKIAVVEHLLAACAGMGVDNVRIDIDGPEVPIMDGSSAVFCELIAQVGQRAQRRLRRRIRILQGISVEDGQKKASLLPSDERCLSLHACIDFKSRAIGRQEMALRLRPGLFAKDLAFARTFGFARDVETLQAMGLARGGSLENAVVIDGDEILNPEGLRRQDEFIRHKILDAVGDLFLAGAPIAGRYVADQPGHALNNALVRKLLSTPTAWCWEDDRSAADRASSGLEPLSAIA
ncbi:MAG: UDP-3-O-acyl-N-acetylglucosamine deacetylase [Pseudomonadota bacterium]